MSPRSVRPRRAAFTLVELLVVIGIIGLLISILLPTLGKAREQARAVKCKSNMRSIYTACLLWSNDNKGYVPKGNKVDDTSAGNQNAYLLEQCMVWLLIGINGQGSCGKVDFERGAIWRYISPQVDTRKQIVMCPSDEGQDPMRFGGVMIPSEGVRTMSYSLNSRIWGEPTEFTYPAGKVPYGIKWSRVIKQTEKIFICEELAPNDAYCTSIWQTDGDDVPSGRHGARRRQVNPGGTQAKDTAGSGNYVFFDGHVEERAISQIVGNHNEKLFRPLSAH